MITQHTKESLIAFEDYVKELWEHGHLPSLIHLCGGNEDQLLEIFSEIRHQDWVFASHRAHYHALLKGIPDYEVIDAIAKDNSMFIFDKYRRFYQSAILAGNCGIAVGVALAIKESGEDAHVYCFLGDGASENGHYFEAVLYTSGHDLPLTFILENNNIQVDTDVLTRRGMERHPLSAEPCVREYRYKPTYPHAGSGSKHHITFKRTHPLK